MSQNIDNGVLDVHIILRICLTIRYWETYMYTVAIVRDPFRGKKRDTCLLIYLPIPWLSLTPTFSPSTNLVPQTFEVHKCCGLCNWKVYRGNSFCALRKFYCALRKERTFMEPMHKKRVKYAAQKFGTIQYSPLPSPLFLLSLQLGSCPLPQGQGNHSHSLGPHGACLLLKLLTQLFLQKLSIHIQYMTSMCVFVFAQ